MINFKFLFKLDLIDISSIDFYFSDTYDKLETEPIFTKSYPTVGKLENGAIIVPITTEEIEELPNVFYAEAEINFNDGSSVKAHARAAKADSPDLSLILDGEEQDIIVKFHIDETGKEGSYNAGDGIKIEDRVIGIDVSASAWGSIASMNASFMQTVGYELLSNSNIGFITRLASDQEFGQLFINSAPWSTLSYYDGLINNADFVQALGHASYLGMALASNAALYSDQNFTSRILGDGHWSLANIDEDSGNLITTLDEVRRYQLLSSIDSASLSTFEMSVANMSKAIKKKAIIQVDNINSFNDFNFAPYASFNGTSYVLPVITGSQLIENDFDVNTTGLQIVLNFDEFNWEYQAFVTNDAKDAYFTQQIPIIGNIQNHMMTNIIGASFDSQYAITTSGYGKRY